ncbi:hypothetical protein BJ994_002706 [Arthrobacter pigmenti]|nr:hypothetical protein [Arthrobacter pigmenti]
MPDDKTSNDKPKDRPPGAIKPLVITNKLTELSEAGRQFEESKRPP